jgi:hypothetical protein
LRTVKQVSNYATGKVQDVKKRMTWLGTRGAVLLAVGIPSALLLGLLDAAAGGLVVLVLVLPGLVLVVLAASHWNDYSNRVKGIRGEELVAQELAGLSDEFMLLNDVMLDGGHGNIDHVVLGPTGVFVIETKNYTGKFVCYGDNWFFQGYRRKYPRPSISMQARNNAIALGNLLHSSGFTVRVTPIIVFTNGYVQYWLHHPTIWVLRSGEVCGYLLAQRPSFQMSPAYLDKIAERIQASSGA